MLQSKWGNYGKFNGEKLELERFIKRYKNYSFEIVDELYGYNQVLYSGQFKWTFQFTLRAKLFTRQKSNKFQFVGTKKKVQKCIDKISGQGERE